MKAFLIMILAAINLLGVEKNTKQAKFKYIALGDSYTICTGTKNENEQWPAILSKHLSAKGIQTQLTDNPALNGFSTQNLIDYELSVVEEKKPDFVTLLIGVNDWVRGVDAKSYRKNLSYIIDEVQKNLSNKNNLILITIPDFGVTSQGKLYGNGRNISKGIESFNTIIKEEAGKRKLICVDIFPLSQKMKSDPSLVADDGLHPSAKEYAEWEKLIFTEAKKLLSKN